MWEKTSESSAERSCVRFKRPPRRCVGLLDKDVSFRHFPRGFAQVAQLVEQGIENPRVGGSIPSLGTAVPPPVPVNVPVPVPDR